MTAETLPDITPDTLAALDPQPAPATADAAATAVLPRVLPVRGVTGEPPAALTAAAGPTPETPQTPAEASEPDAPAAGPAEGQNAPEASAEPAAPPAVERAATPGQIATWIGEAGRIAGEPISYTVTDYIRTAHVHVPDAEAFRGWCRYVGATAATYREDSLAGKTAEVSVMIAGWALHVRLTGQAVEGLR